MTFKKLNLGCGYKHKEGFINVDNFSECDPDMLHDLEVFPYPFATNSVDEIVLDNVLEHLGQTFEIFNKVIRELYRISTHGANVRIKVPHPRHDNFLGDPTHVRAILPQTLALYDQEMNKQWIAEKSANSPLGILHNINFKINTVNFIPDNKYHDALQKGLMSEGELHDLVSNSNNVVAEIEIHLLAVKD